MSTALRTAKSVAEHFTLSQEAIAGGVLDAHIGKDEGTVTVLRAISADIDRVGIALLDMMRDHKDAPDVFLPTLYAKCVELGERVVFKLSVLLDGQVDPPLPLQDAHLCAVLALAMARDYLTNGEVGSDGEAFCY